MNIVLTAGVALPGFPTPESWAALTRADFGFFALASAIIALSLCALFFAIVAGALRVRNRGKQQQWQRRESKWEQQLLEVLAGSAKSEDLRALVEEGEELYFVDYLLRFARRLRGRSRDTLAELARPYLDPIADRASRGGDAERRARAIETIAALDFDRNHQQILAALRDPSPLVSMVAARSIARNQDAQHLKALLEHLARLQDWSPRQLSTLLTAMGPEAVPALREAAIDPAYPAPLRAVALDALRQLHDPDAACVAALVLGTDNGRDLNAAALRLLAVVGRAEHAPHARRFSGHTDAVVRSAAIRALSAIGEPEDHHILVQGLEDTSDWVAIQAANALLETGNGRSLHALARSSGPRAALAQQVLVEWL